MNESFNNYSIINYNTTIIFLNNTGLNNSGVNNSDITEKTEKTEDEFQKWWIFLIVIIGYISLIYCYKHCQKPKEFLCCCNNNINNNINNINNNSSDSEEEDLYYPTPALYINNSLSKEKSFFEKEETIDKLKIIQNNLELFPQQECNICRDTKHTLSILCCKGAEICIDCFKQIEQDVCPFCRTTDFRENVLKYDFFDI